GGRGPRRRARRAGHLGVAAGARRGGGRLTRPPSRGGGNHVLTLADIAFDDAAALLARYGVRLERVADGMAIPGSYWGEAEAGIVGATVYARGDTPVHSLLHEAGHLIVLPPE